MKGDSCRYTDANMRSDTVRVAERDKNTEINVADIEGQTERNTRR